MKRRFSDASVTGQPAGFTMIEILVVISIISVLILLLLPILSRVREAGRRIQCLTQLRQIATAHQLYAVDYKGYFFYAPGGVPARNFPEFWPRTLGAGLDVPDPLTHQGYLATSSAFYCPNYRNLPGAGANDWSYNRRTSYCHFVNSYNTGSADPLPSPYGWTALQGKRVDTVDTVAPDEALAQDVYVDRAIGTVASLHSDGVNVVFTDGHGRYVIQEELAADHVTSVHWYTAGTFRMYKDRM